MELMELVVYGLAVWRLAALLVHERGPFDVFLKIRKLADIVHDENGNAVIVPNTFLGGVLSCVWCASVWIAFFMTIFWNINHDLSLKFSVLFAFSAVAILIEEHLKRGKT